jgi:hypothetical protein
MRWVFAAKYNSDGTIERYKARGVVRGDQQRPGIDYDPNNIYAPVVGITTLRLILAIATILDYEIYQMDVKTAFLNATIHDELYMKQPQGYNDGTDRVCKLLKAMYGTKQAPFEWNELLHAFMLSQSWTPCISDPCIYFYLSKTGNIMIFAVFVDDCISIVSTYDIDEYNVFKTIFMNQYHTTDLGNAEFILKIKITRNRIARTLFLSQELYIEKVIQKYGLNNAKSVSIPEPNNIHLTHASGPLSTDLEHIEMMKDKPYRELVGSLLYATHTRIDIAHAVNIVSRYLNNPGILHWNYAKHIIKYLKGTSTYGLLYNGYELDGITIKTLTLSSYSDADWAGNIDTFRSTTGGLIYLGGNLIDGFTRSQHTVSLSSTESEYIAMTETLKQLKYCNNILNELKIIQIAPIILYCDNEGAIRTSMNKGMVTKLKHMNIRFHFIKDEVRNHFIKLQHIKTKQQLADILTKKLTPKPFKFLRDQLVNNQQQQQQ